MNILAAHYWKLLRLDLSFPLFEETLRLRQAASGDEHPETLLVMANLSLNYTVAGRLDDPLLEEALRKCKVKFGVPNTQPRFCR